MATCPNGHPSESDDWCDECGLRLSEPPVPPAPPPPPPPPFNPAFRNISPEQSGAQTTAVETCPHCGTPREGKAAFCEECRHNFLTLPPLPPGRSSAAAGRRVPPSFPPPAYPPLSERTGSRPSQINRPAEPLPANAAITGAIGTDEPAPPPPPPPPPPPAPAGSDSGDFLLPPPTSARTLGTEQSPPPPPAPTQSAPESWTAVVSADRDYFTATMARSGPEASGLFFPQFSPELHVPLTQNQITIGRRRHTTGESPVIDLSRPPEDPGVSHRHAVLVRRPGGGWSVIDQDSTNGTTVNSGADPIAPFRPVDLADGDRVHVGAWTTITLRRE